MSPSSHFVIFAIVFATLQNFVFIRAAEDASTLTIAPAGQTGLFANLGPLNPHAYRPNEFFSSNWVYEGERDRMKIAARQDTDVWLPQSVPCSPFRGVAYFACVMVD
jgi:hypothetical protein